MTDTTFEQRNTEWQATPEAQAFKRFYGFDGTIGDNKVVSWQAATDAATLAERDRVEKEGLARLSNAIRSGK